MDIIKNGLIIFTNNYDEQVAFYTSIFQGKELFKVHTQLDKVYCLEVGDIYIMIEKLKGLDIGENNQRVKLRFNITKLEDAVEQLTKYNIPFEHKSYKWGDVVNFEDIDGNMIGIREVESFNNQIKNYVNE